MADTGTGLRQSLRLLYRNYGGWHSLVTSEYFWLSLLLSGACWRIGVDEKWADTARSILPTLAGFSIAAYAIFFAVLDERARNALRAPSPDLGDRSPLLILASSISHAVFVQICALLCAVVFPAKPFPYVACFGDWNRAANLLVSFSGLFLTVYGVVLVLAAVLSIFRILEIRTRI